ncbi:MAG: DUF5060 domain-containing protein [Thermoanaerobaculia bacterium]|nr:DUF5060 domain-containing protein [Thermoanaerobaculia bacterium]
MNKYLLPGSVFLPVFFLFRQNLLPGQAPVIDSAVALSGQVEQYGKFECLVYLKAAVVNPYDFDEITVRGRFTGPDGQTIVADGFFMQDFSLNATNGNLTPAGAGGFRVRFCPAQPGDWQWVVEASTAAGSATGIPQKFTCTPSAKKGFVRRSAGNYFQFDNGEPYIPNGQNVCWQNGNIYLDYKNWLGDMAAKGANFFRLWMAHWGLGIEWKNNNSGFSGLKKYKQSAAWFIDWMLDYSAQHNLYLMLCINHHGQYSSTVNPNWSENPYNAALGGPLAQPQQFFSNPAAKALHKNRLRYIVARWGYSTQLQCWELFNEVDLTENFDANAANVVNWHQEMSDYLKSVDPYQHLVSTSGSKPGAFDDIWELPSIDFTQEHVYRNVANIEVPVAETARELLNDFGKPSLIGEFGLSGSGTQTAADDPAGVHLHNSLWAGLFSGSAGTAMTWWWDSYTEPQNLYHHFAGPATVAAQIPFASGQYRPIAAPVSGGPPSDAAFSPAAGWGASTAALFTVDANGDLTPGVTNLSLFLYGATWNTQYRNPPQFSVTFPAASRFRVRTGANTGLDPKIVISLDGVVKINQNAQVSTTYTIDVPAGQHTIKVDNLGTDWIEIAEYVFEKIGNGVHAFVLRSASGEQAAGWVHHKAYNWQRLKTNGPPPSATGATVTLPNMAAGQYVIKWWDCATGNLLNAATAAADASGNLALSCPDIQWDVAFTAGPEVVSVLNAGKQKTAPAVLFPSPASLNSSVYWSAGKAEQGNWSARFFDAKGQQLKETILSVPGDAPAAFSTAGLPAGLITIVLENGQERRTGVFILAE